MRQVNIVVQLKEKENEEKVRKEVEELIKDEISICGIACIIQEKYDYAVAVYRNKGIPCIHILNY